MADVHAIVAKLGPLARRSGAVDTGTKVFAVVGGLWLVFVGMWAVIHNNGEHVRFSASVGSSYSPAMRRFSGIVVAVVGIVAATVAVVQLAS